MATKVCDSDEEWVDDDGDEELMPTVATRCLFCETSLPDPTQIWTHCRDEHAFNMSVFVNKFQLDCFGYIKFVNYCRNKKPSASDVDSWTSPAAWSGDEFMKPVVEDDGLLTFDVEDVSLACPAGENGVHHAEDVAALSARCQAAEQRASQAEEALQRLTQDMDKMKVLAQTLVMSAAPEPSPSHAAIANLQEDDDNLYFGSYAHFGIHQDMLQDRVRTQSYQDAIYKNAEHFKDAVVLDIGCGTGILSMFAARCGAKKVIGVDMSEIAFQAIDIVRENDLSDVITIIKGRVEDIELPVEQVDIIISEWMGYFLLYESMLDTVLYARDRWLRPGGVVLPNICNISIVGLQDAHMRQRHLDFWTDVYGFKMTCMQSPVLHEPCLSIVDSEKVVTDAAEIKMIDIHRCTTSELEFTSPFQLKGVKDCEITSFVAYFDVWFDALTIPIHFSTSPFVLPTHWKQTIFQLEEPITLKKDEVLEGQLICKKNRKDPRSLKITISWQGKTATYHMQ